jgi:hypothetical protein
VIEATTAQDARTSHWRKDLFNLETRLPVDRLGGLIWITWCDLSSPTDEGIMSDQVCRLGFSREDVHIIFRKQLCSLLLNPYHSRLWLNDLGLSVTPDPFSRISDVIRRSGKSQGLRIFPSLEEFESDLVHSPRLLVKVEKALAECGVAIVVGHGASGKTTLGYLLANRLYHKHSPSYILDLAKTESDPSLVAHASQALTLFADTGVLFIIDNAHLDPDAADSLIEQWQEFGRGSELLILMRRVRAKAEVWDSYPKLEEGQLPCFDLIVETSDLEGIYRRLYIAKNSKLPPQLDSGLLNRWLSLFGGDLIAFSAGVLGLFERDGDPVSLGPDDASAWVRHNYLTLSHIEVSALLDLAAVAEIEVLVPIETFDDGALDSYIQRGLVWVEERGSKRKYYYYSLAHPGLATLLRRAANCDESSRKDRLRILRNHTSVCCLAAVSQAASGNTEEAKELLFMLWQDSNWPFSNISICYWERPLSLTEELGVVSSGEMVARSQGWLAHGSSRSTLVRSALTSSTSHLERILDFTDKKTPQISAALREELSMLKNKAYLTECVLTSYLGGVRSLINFAFRERLELGRIIVDILKADENRDRVVCQALNTPLAGLAYFLDYAEEKIPEVARAIRESMASNPELLINQALRTPLDQLAFFLAYAREKMSDEERFLQSQLLMSANLERMAERAVRDGPEKITAMCNHEKEYAKVLSFINVDKWSQRWGNARIGQPDWIITFFSNCYNQGCVALVAPLAASLVRHGRAEDFPAPSINIRHLAFIVTSPLECTSSEIEQFLTRNFAPSWLGRQYSSPEATVGALAGALRAITMSDHEFVRRYFVHSALFERLVAEQPVNRPRPRHIAEWLQLLGAARLLNNEVTMRQQRIDSSAVLKALMLWPPRPADQGIQPIQAGLWAGLREWCHITQSQLVVPSELAEAVLAQFRVSDPQDRPRVSALNTVMIDWLERCKDNGWKLVCDESSLLTVVEHQIHSIR